VTDHEILEEVMAQHSIDFQTIDLIIFIIANLANLLLVCIFLARSKRKESLEYILGLIFVFLALPAGIGAILNILTGREWWTILFPLLLVGFCAIELCFDYIFKLNFRNNALLWPYVISFYCASIGMVGYAFGIGKLYGFITLATYFLNLAATWYAYKG
jgi:hypothetical protein